MFLKRIEINGFKSFADKTTFNFDENITGIVGPNGCGKSNIADAVRWAMGEQSNKSLRSGSDRSDLVFSGNSWHKAGDIASVSLVFDNSREIFPIDEPEIEIMRRYQKSTNKSFYYINSQLCQLKDITDLMLDVGLGKDSLSIISQGNILNFAEARPEERRLLFEEASGVSKYKKRKAQSLTKLAAMDSNLNRVRDLLAELENQIPGLEEQAKAARLYQQLSEKIRRLDLSILTNQIAFLEEKIKESRIREEQIEQSIQAVKEELSLKQGQLEEIDHNLFLKEADLEGLRTSFQELQQKNIELEKEQAVLQERQKQLLDSTDRNLKQQGIKTLYLQRQSELDKLLKDLAENQKKEGVLLQEKQTLGEKNQTLSGKVSALEQDFIRLQERLSYYSNSSQSRRNEQLEELLKLPGIYGQILDLFQIETGYERAIEEALGARARHLAGEDEQKVKNAVDYLKKRKFSRFTFLPASSLQPRFLKAKDRLYLDYPGVKGLASEFVSTRALYQPYVNALLQNILIVDTLENALDIYRDSNHAFRMVTLDGDLLSVDGSIAAGASRKVQEEKQQRSLKQKLSQIEKDLEREKTKLKLQKEQEQQLDERLFDIRLSLEKLQTETEEKKAELSSLQIDEQIEETLKDSQKEQDFFETLYQSRADLESLQIQEKDLAREISGLKEQQSSLQKEIRSLQRRENEEEKGLNALQVEMAQGKAMQSNYLDQLSENYKITFEAALMESDSIEINQARKELKQLKQQLDDLGLVNQQALSQYDELMERYNFLSRQIEELSEAKQELVRAIEQMDVTMKEQFLQTLKAINARLNPIFQSMFGGGNARLFLSDPDNVLESGVEIEANPPGKQMKSLQAYSGGEKSLIAICVLFAILQAKTVPLCVFDEVEAALDQANVDRFARYLQFFKSDTQFLIITHRQGTMEQCDQLYGITMAQDGISRILQANLKGA